MAAASAFTQTSVINALLRGTSFTIPTGAYISLHTASPGTTGANEVTTSAMPAYVRKDAAVGGAIATGWGAPSSGVTTNLKQVVYPSNNGATSITVTHWAVWDAATSGNMIAYGSLSTSRTLAVGDVLVFDVGSITVSLV